MQTKRTIKQTASLSTWRESYLQLKNNTAEGLFIVHCNTFRSWSVNPSYNSSLPQDRRMGSPWGWSKVHIQGHRSSPAGLANSGAGSNSPGGCNADSDSAQSWSRGGPTPSLWVSRSRRKRRRRRSPAASSCCSPRGCRASATPVRSRKPGGEGDTVDGEDCFEQEFANVSCDVSGSPGMPVSGVFVFTVN